MPLTLAFTAFATLLNNDELLLGGGPAGVFRAPLGSDSRSAISAVDEPGVSLATEISEDPATEDWPVGVAGGDDMGAADGAETPPIDVPPGVEDPATDVPPGVED